MGTFKGYKLSNEFANRLNKMEKTKEINFVIMITPKYDNRNECKNIVEQVKRHIDDISDISISCVTICIHCGSIWEKEWTDGEKPMCCNKAGEVWQKEEDESNISQ